MAGHWDGDLLGFREVGETFTKLVKSVSPSEPGSKVISIEAGFGRGKTFFRERWAKDLRGAGEVVVEIDARQSDHSGDPVVTFIGALVGALGKDEKTRAEKAKAAGLKYGGLLGRTVVKAAVGKAADELFDELGKKLEDGDVNEMLKAAFDGVGDGMSKFAAETIAAQLKAEEMRVKEMPKQLDDLRKALAGQDGRVVVLIDELDRCHPDYAITLLEAMKLVFDRPGYVFVLMVNAEHLERIAAHRFVGFRESKKGEAAEPYLDKFVDMRLKLPVGTIADATNELFKGLPPPKEPFGSGPEYTIGRAATLAADLVQPCSLTMRQVKRVFLRVELAVRMYQGTPVDVPLLVWLAFQDRAEGKDFSEFIELLPRAAITPVLALEWSEAFKIDDDEARNNEFRRIVGFVQRHGEALVFPEDQLIGGTRYISGDQIDRLFSQSARVYLPSHKRMLDAVHQMIAD